MGGTVGALVGLKVVGVAVVGNNVGDKLGAAVGEAVGSGVSTPDL